MSARLFVIHGSHPCVTVEQALLRKGVPYSVTEILPGMQVGLRPFFGNRTVPAIRFEDGVKVQGSRAIVRELERRVPDPPLYGGDRAAEIDEAERWGDEVYQPLPRRILWAAMKRSPETMHGFQAGQRNPKMPLAAVRLLSPAVTRIEELLNSTNDDRARATIAELPAMFDHVDELLGRGVLAGDNEPPSAADLQIAPTTRLLHSITDLRPMIAGRPCEAHAFRWLAPNQAEVAAGVLPASWLEAVVPAPGERHEPAQSAGIASGGPASRT